MKKLVLLLVLIIIATFALAACGGQTEDSPAQTTIVTGDGNVDSDAGQGDEPSEPEGSDDNDNVNLVEDDAHSPDAFVFTFRDVVIEMNKNVTYVINQLGEPDGVFEAPSCAFDGIDRIFAYGTAIQIYTYPLGDNDYIHTVAFFDDTVRTTDGRIRLYDTVEAVINAYGDDYEYDTGMYTFTRGRTVLEFLTADGVVIGISYRYLIDG